jgi:hypothetical protein
MTIIVGSHQLLGLGAGFALDHSTGPTPHPESNGVLAAATVTPAASRDRRDQVSHQIAGGTNAWVVAVTT